MKNSQILMKFLQHYPEHMEDLTSWCPSEGNSIILNLEDGTSLVFTYNSENSWFLKPARKNRECAWFEKLFQQ